MLNSEEESAPCRLKAAENAFPKIDIEPKTLTKEQLEDQFRIDLYDYQYLIYQRMVGYCKPQLINDPEIN